MNLLEKKCNPGSGAHKIDNIQEYLTYVSGWSLANGQIVRRFEFKNFKQTMFFMNAVAYICENENHHPDVCLGYNYCQLGFSTHDINGISENDFICAAKVNQLVG